MEYIVYHLLLTLSAINLISYTVYPLLISFMNINVYTTHFYSLSLKKLTQYWIRIFLVQLIWIIKLISRFVVLVKISSNTRFFLDGRVHNIYTCLFFVFIFLAISCSTNLEKEKCTLSFDGLIGIIQIAIGLNLSFSWDPRQLLHIVVTN